MSGRLVILRHKKWNVWNQDNVEKVLRDERLHKEETDEKKRLERYQNNAQIRETLQRRDENDSEETALTLIPSAKAEDTGNEEYRREEEERDLLKRRREGIAPWALSDTQPGNKKITPWYMREAGDKTVSVYAKGYVQVGEGAQLVLDRDEKRKRSIDPMASFISEREEVAESKDEGGNFYDKLNIMGMQPAQRSDASSPIHKHKKHKKDKKSKKSKKEEKHRNEDAKHALREKRLERERAERKRANTVITQHEKGAVNRHKYSEQYNPDYTRY